MEKILDIEKFILEYYIDISEQNIDKLKEDIENKAARAIENSKQKALLVKQKADIEAAEILQRGQEQAEMIKEIGNKRIENLKSK